MKCWKMKLWHDQMGKESKGLSYIVKRSSTFAELQAVFQLKFHFYMYFKETDLIAIFSLFSQTGTDSKCDNHANHLSVSGKE